jgi:hypothetical protein
MRELLLKVGGAGFRDPPLPPGRSSGNDARMHAFVRVSIDGRGLNGM